MGSVIGGSWFGVVNDIDGLHKVGVHKDSAGCSKVWIGTQCIPGSGSQILSGGGCDPAELPVHRTLKDY